MNDEVYAVMVEGKAEKAIIDILLDYDLLIFGRDSLFKNKIFSRQKAKHFCDNHLKIAIEHMPLIRIIDSKKEKFDVPEVYKSKIDVLDCFTTPEIEILIIIAKGDYQSYSNKFKSKMKPSEYVKQQYGINKSYDSHYDFWEENVQELERSLKTYKTIHKNDQDYYLCDFLKNKDFM